MSPLNPQYSSPLDARIAAKLAAEKAEQTMPEYIEDTSQVVSVWSAYGHTFMSADENMKSCLTCGAMYQLMALADDPTRGEYMAANGDEPQECSHDTSMAHGYPGEREHQEGNSDHDCNCISCNS